MSSKYTIKCANSGSVLAWAPNEYQARKVSSSLSFNGRLIHIVDKFGDVVAIFRDGKYEKVVQDIPEPVVEPKPEKPKTKPKLKPEKIPDPEPEPEKPAPKIIIIRRK